MAQRPQDPPSRIGAALVTFAVLLVAVVNLGGLAGWNAAVLAGRLVDADSYLRLLHLLDLRLGRPWFEDMTSRLGAPEGLLIQWTRPLDLLILLPALAVERIGGVSPREALFLVGMVVSPVLHAAAALAAAWAARAVWGGRAPWYAVLLMVGAPAAATYSALGRPDHHGLIILLLTLGLGATLRAVLPGGGVRAALGAGATFGLAIWVGPEAKLIALPALGGVGLASLLAADGRHLAAQGRRAALALAAVIALAMAVEHRPAEWLRVEYDRVALPDPVLALAAAAVFAVAERLGAEPRGRRAAAAGLAAALALALLIALFPGLPRGPLADADPGYLRLFHPIIQENQPLPPFGPGDPREVAGYLSGGALAGLLALALAARATVADGRWPAGLVLALALLAGIAATFGARRFGMDLVPPAAIAGAGLVGLLLQAAWPRAPALRAGLATLLFFGGLALPFLADGAARQAATGQEGERIACDWTAMGRWLDAARPLLPAGGRRVVLMASDIFEGPELAWRTPYDIVASPHHRAGAAIEDTFALFGATDPAAARAILARRGVALLLACPSQSYIAMPPGSLGAMLRDGAGPEWLEPIPLPPHLAGFRLLAVRF
jgi:hypothetical protein